MLTKESDRGKSPDLIKLEDRTTKLLKEIIAKDGVPKIRMRKLLRVLRATDRVGENRGLRFGDAILKSQDLCPRCWKVLFCVEMPKSKREKYDRTHGGEV